MEDIHNNPIVLKIRNGTPRSDINLCSSCRHSHKLRTVSGHDNVRCLIDTVPVVMREAVVECNRYSDKNAVPLYEMKEIAWTLHTNKQNKVGFEFLTPAQRKEKGLDD